MRIKMKTINILLVGIIAFSIAGCKKDFLDLQPLTERTEQNFYRTPADANTALIGCYDGLQQVWNGGIALPLASEVLSDNCFGGTGASDGFSYQMIDEFDKERAPSDRNVYETNWTNYYRTIFRCNKLLEKMDDIDWAGNDALRMQYEAETRFVRAYCYFDMVRFFGNIPLLEVPTTDNVPQADPDEVYALIATDLAFGADNLPATPYAAANDGRATKWAASSLLARAYLYYTGYYQKSELPTQSGSLNSSQVLTYLEEVIDQSGHSLLDDFAALWPAASVDAYAGEGNPETVFSIKYTYTSDYNGNADGNHWMVMFGMRQTDWYPYGRGWGGATVTQRTYDSFDDTDARKFASVTAVDEEGIELDIATQREYTGYYCKKYMPMSTPDGQSVAESLGGTNFQIGQFQDYVSIRYADVLLMAAELGSANAQEYLDRVRERSYKENFSSVPATKDNIMEERRLEFAFEGHRYWDLLRQGLGVAADAINESGVTVFNGGGEVTKSVSFDEATLGLQQIPYNQIDLSNGMLEQNAGW